MTGVVMKRGDLNTDTHMGGEDPENMKAEMRVMCLTAREHQRLLANHQKLEDGLGTDPLSQSSGGSLLANILI